MRIFILGLDSINHTVRSNILPLSLVNKLEINKLHKFMIVKNTSFYIFRVVIMCVDTESVLITADLKILQI